MKRYFTTFVLAFFWLPFIGYAENIFKFHHVPTSGNESAVLVLIPGMNTDGEFFLSEKLWTEFAKTNNLGLIALNYHSDVEDLFVHKKGYFYPDQGSGAALIQEIRRLYGKDLPVLIYGFSGGAQFTGRFVDFAPDRILAWCAYSAQFWDEPKDEKSGTKARGIVACGEFDGMRWQPSFAFFYQGRMKNRPWVWLSISNAEHNRSARLESFVREFFAEELAIHFGKKKAEEDIIVDISTTDNPLLELSDSRALKCVFRNQALVNSWTKIHSQ